MKGIESSQSLQSSELSYILLTPIPLLCLAAFIVYQHILVCNVNFISLPGFEVC